MSVLTKKIKVEWDLDGVSLEEARVHEIVEVPLYGYRGGRSVSDYLSDMYGWLVLDWWHYDNPCSKTEGDVINE